MSEPKEKCARKTCRHLSSEHVPTGLRCRTEGCNCEMFWSDDPLASTEPPSQAEGPLLPCPFCGELPDGTDIIGVCNNYSVQCPGCNAQGPIVEYPNHAFEQWDRRIAGQRESQRRVDEKIDALMEWAISAREVFVLGNGKESTYVLQFAEVFQKLAALKGHREGKG